MRSSRTWITIGLAAVGILLVFYVYLKYRVAPDIDFQSLPLTELDGRPVPDAFGDGKGRIVCFSASWCGSCIKELRELKKVSGELRGTEVLVISDEPGDRIARWIDREQFPFRFLRMEKEFNAVGIHSIPTVYVLGPGGEVRKDKSGSFRWSDASTREHIIRLTE